MFKQFRAEVLFEAVQPISHQETTIGNHGVQATAKVRRRGGGFAKVPEVSGNAMRNRMRYASSLATLRAAGMLGESLTEPAIRLLFNGGKIVSNKGKGKDDKKKGGGGISMDRYRELCEIVPPLRIFGGCTENRIVPGMLSVSSLDLVCEENERFLPPWIVGWLHDQNERLDSARDHLEVRQNVSMDPALNPSMRTLMLPDAQVEVTNRLARSEQAHRDDEATADADKSGMMPYTYERIVKGALFYWRTWVTVTSPLEEDTFRVILSELRDHGPIVGGKSGTGHGELAIIGAKGVELVRAVEKADALDIGAPNVGSLFVPHVQERKDRLREFLSGVAA